MPTDMYFIQLWLIDSGLALYDAIWENDNAILTFFTIFNRM